MSTCHGCGGVIGIDCYNPGECALIAQDKARQWDALETNPAELQARCDAFEGAMDQLAAVLRELWLVDYSRRFPTREECINSFVSKCGPYLQREDFDRFNIGALT